MANVLIKDKVYDLTNRYCDDEVVYIENWNNSLDDACKDYMSVNLMFVPRENKFFLVAHRCVGITELKRADVKRWLIEHGHDSHWDLESCSKKITNATEAMNAKIEDERAAAENAESAEESTEN